MNNKRTISIIDTDQVDNMMGQIRHCAICDAQFNFNDVIKRFPPSGQKQLREFWFNKRMKFYCTSCYFLKLIQYLKKIKHQIGEGKEELK